jgi:hypothetical protein
MTTHYRNWTATLVCTVLLIGGSLLGQQRANPPAPQGAPGGPPAAGRAGRGGPPQPMSFFVTSVGLGRGGNLGGLAGADAHCQALATAAGRGNVTWRAYLSTQGPGAVNARDRIGNGPWYNQRGQVIARSVAELHGDTLEQARIGNFISLTNSLDEKGQPVPSNFPGSEHDILTGSTLEGRAFTDNTRDATCSNWTSAADGGVADGVVPDPLPPGLPSARLGHSDKGNLVPSWNSSHPSRGCSQASLVATGGGGRFYCFATN